MARDYDYDSQAYITYLSYIVRVQAIGHCDVNIDYMVDSIEPFGARFRL